jgi:hypothetical protein
MKTEFNDWWDKDLLTEDNPYEEGTPAYWAWEGWSAGVNAKREACEKLAGVEWADNGRCAAAIRVRGNK